MNVSDFDDFKYIISNINIYKLILEKKDNIFQYYNDNRDTLLMNCIRYNPYIEIINLLIKKSDDINITNKYGSTALIYACIKESKNIIYSLLTKKNIDLNIQDMYGNTALMYACERKNIDIINILLKNENINLNIENYKLDNKLLSIIINDEKLLILFLSDLRFQLDDIDIIKILDKNYSFDNFILFRLTKNNNIKLSLNKKLLICCSEGLNFKIKKNKIYLIYMEKLKKK